MRARSRILVYPLATLNPYTELFAQSLTQLGLTVSEYRPGKLRQALGARALHVHWPEQGARSSGKVRSIGKGAIFLAEVALLKMSGTRIVWTAHNSWPHERGLVSDLSFRCFLRMTDGVLHLSHNGRRVVEADHEFLGRRPSLVVDHGDTSSPYRLGASRESARAASRRELCVDSAKMVVGSFGRARRYKALAQLDGAVAGAPEVTLVRPRVTSDQLPDSREVALTIAASDLVALPFHSVLHSGSACVSVGLETPILVPDVEAFRELQERHGPHLVLLYEPPLTTNKLRTALETLRVQQQPDHDRYPGFMDWTLIGSLASALY